MNKKVVRANGKDFHKLERAVSEKKNGSYVIYGAGTNGEVFLGYLHLLGIEISYFVDKQAEIYEFEVLGKKVISPATFINSYQGETIIISPDNNAGILEWLVENGIDKAQIILPFAEVEQSIIDEKEYGLKTIEYQKKPPGNIKATIFSIVYNTPEKLLRRAIESILQQTEQEFEYLIIDNGSIDSSAKIIKQYCEMDCRIKVITFKENLLWTSSVLLETLQGNILGKYVAQLDSDDYYHPTFLEKTLLAAQNNRAELVQVNTLTYPEDDFKYASFTQKWNSDIVIAEEQIPESFALRILNVTVWGKLYTRELFETLLTKMLLCSEEDRKKRFLLDISWMAVIAGTITKACLCNEILHVRTWRKGSGEFTSDNILNWLGAIVYSIDLLKSKTEDKTLVSVFADAALLWLFGLNRSGLALADFEESLINHPSVKQIVKRPFCSCLFADNQHS